MAQSLGIAATAALIVGLFLAPDKTLHVMWNLLMPVLPATFLVAPALWRGICPLATLNLLLDRKMGRRTLGPGLLPGAGAVGIALLVIMVPARRFVFNENGPVLAVTIIAVGLLALLLGLAFDKKAGFCNAICPILPVERLYGQHPLISLGNPHCRPCTLCTTQGCLDLFPARSIPETVGSMERPHGWLKTVYGLFAAAYLGFVAGSFTLTNVPLSGMGSVYVHMLVWMAVSYLGTALLVRLLNLRAAVAFAVLGGVSVGLYYWFAAPVVAAPFGATVAVTGVIRVLALLLVAVWFWRAAGQIRKEGLVKALP
ncbi:MAG: hypothetical protein V3U35_07595 [Candidatus Neomarinimicrobiota bacterium]